MGFTSKFPPSIPRKPWFYKGSQEVARRAISVLKLPSLTNSWENAQVSFQSEIKIHFDDADPAGICFFAQVFTKIHQVYEEFIGHLGQNPQHFFSGKEFLVPIRHTEAEYHAPLRVLEKYQVELDVSKISKTSFRLNYKIKNKDRLCAVLSTTHVFLKAASLEKCSIPAELKTGLQKFQKNLNS